MLRFRRSLVPAAQTSARCLASLAGGRPPPKPPLPASPPSRAAFLTAGAAGLAGLALAYSGRDSSRNEAAQPLVVASTAEAVPSTAESVPSTADDVPSVAEAGASMAEAVPSQQCSEGSSASPNTDVPEKKTAHAQGGNERIIAREEVSKHNSKEDIWVTFQGGVYDITEFVNMHPGGDKILLAAGKSIEPFWSMYAIHLNGEAQKLLDEYRIGSLPQHELKDEPDLMDAYAQDPDRSGCDVTVNTLKPFNAEAPLMSLVNNDITPNRSFFIRNHLPVPSVQLDAYELEICGEGLPDDVVLTLDDLKQFPKHTVRVTIQCAGNRRSSMHEVAPVRGLQWGQGAISTAEWSGALLTDVLGKYGFSDNANVKHVHFEGLDRDTEKSYGASVPKEKFLDPRGDVLLAYEMNGEPIPADHGFPVRAIVPGTVGARNVKWVSRIVLSDEESGSHWQQLDYKGFSPSADWDNLDYQNAKAIQELPVQSAIATPVDGARISDDRLEVKGYAVSGGGREIIRVDVSIDGGKTWSEAKLSDTDQMPGRHWAHRRWEASFEIPEEKRSGTELDVVCKAVDRSYNVQPERFEPIFNIRGVLCNAWHRIKVKVE